MRPRIWLVLGMLAFPALAPAQTVTVKETDLLGAWRAKLELAEEKAEFRAGLVLWPDGLWWYGGRFMGEEHGGARWRLVGDTLWLGNDYDDYFHPMINGRFSDILEKHGDAGVMDLEIIRDRPPFPVPDSVYWSPVFRDTTTACANGHNRFADGSIIGCGTWVYKVSKSGQQIYLVRLDRLSKATYGVAAKAVLTRDSLADCDSVDGCN